MIAAELPALEIVEATSHLNMKQILVDSTSGSVALGKIGSPPFFVGKEKYIGKDTLGGLEAEDLRQNQGN